MKFIKGSLLLAGAAVLLSACGTSTAAPTPTGTPTVASSTPSAAVKTPENKTIEVKPKDPRTVDVAIVQSIHKGARVTWVPGKIVPAETNNVMVVPVEGAQPEEASFAAGAKFLTPMGCDESESPSLDAEGLGTYECSADEYQNAAGGHRDTKIFFNEQGEIVKMADRYHP
ncbi:hypothetical protein Lesp02_77290 [Lentzea sp. NBRC 105346]|uniref:hypothetical protein n=1 Tax=Lentzea sp. NBRC 105346 TaxID=3032205 RepID=UPI0024A531DC|nr:hypothetical protein [Lentzea sp. NBRC 105346]GLZ35542.1 hypothetical protein Lesp02_77290 [Lentzea sp. NBRC 105346]